MNKNIKLSEMLDDFPDEPKLDKKGYDDMIQHELGRRRMIKGGSGIWKDVGIKYMGDNKLWGKMYGWEIDYYIKNDKKNKDSINEE